MRLPYIIVLVAVFLSSCRQNAIMNNRLDADYSYGLQSKDTVCFQLDSITSHLFIASEYNDKMHTYSFLHQKRLLVYDYKTRRLLKSIQVHAKHPSSYSFINSDTILVADYNSDSFVLMNGTGDIYRTLKVNHSIAYYPFPVNKIAPLRWVDGTIVFWGSMSGEYFDEDSHNRNVMGIMDAESGRVNYQLPYSEVYENRNLGGGLFRWVYACYNSKTDSYVVSFPADHFIYSIHSSGSIDKYYSGSRWIDQILCVNTPKMMPMDSEEKVKHFVENHSYANILYDAYRDVYYRIAEKKTEYKNLLGWQKDISVIVLDNRFNIIGETKIDECNPNYRYAMFVNEKGLHIPQTSSEDVLCFKIYELCSK